MGVDTSSDLKIRVRGEAALAETLVRVTLNNRN